MYIHFKLMISQKKKRNRRKLDRVKTTQRYKERIMTYGQDIFAELDNAYIGTFEVYNTISDVTNCCERLLQCPSVTLMQVARSKGSHVNGVTSERRTKDEYVCQSLTGTDTRSNTVVIYTGPFNYFTKHLPHPYFSVRSSDKVYM